MLDKFFANCDARRRRAAINPIHTIPPPTCSPTRPPRKTAQHKCKHCTVRRWFNQAFVSRHATSSLSWTVHPGLPALPKLPASQAELPFPWEARGSPRPRPYVIFTQAHCVAVYRASHSPPRSYLLLPAVSGGGQERPGFHCLLIPGCCCM